MIRTAFIFLSAATFIFLSACQPEPPPKHHQRHQFGYGSDQPTDVGPTPDSGTTTTTSTPDTGTTDTGPIAPPPPPPPPPPTQSTKPDNTTPNPANSATGAPKKDYPYAQPVPGKPGFVTSPYAPYSGYVDVRGFPPGTEVKDPYTQKVFLVP